MFVNPFEDLLSTELLFPFAFKISLKTFQSQGIEINGFVFERFCDVVVSVIDRRVNSALLL
ncbi:hypothetical protein D3C86_2107550 [compost metagenome]